MIENQPPKWITALLERFLEPRLYDAIMGDLLEDFYEQLSAKGPRAARRHFAWNALGIIRHYRLRKTKKRHSSNFNAMFKNYLKTSLRSIYRRKAYFLLNVLGLSIGLASFIALQKYVEFERSFDKFHENAEDIHRILKYDNGNQTYAVGNYPQVGEKLKSDLPGIVAATRFYNRNNGTLQHTNTEESDRFKDFNVFYADNDFFSVFSFPIVQGSHDLDKPNTIILSESMAARMFGANDPIGKLVHFKDPNFPLLPCKVVGVAQDVPKNSHFTFDALLSINTPVRDGASLNEINWNAFSTYVKVNDQLNNEELDRIARSYFVDNDNLTLRSQVITDIHLNANELLGTNEKNGDKRLINYLSLTSFFILLMAYFNYINFSTAKSLERAKEVGVRKVMGSGKRDLMIQFLVETFVINFISLVLAIFLLVGLAPILPITNVGFNLEGLFKFYGNEIMFIGLGFIVGTIMSGLYPAIMMSSFKPSIILRGKFARSSDGKNIRGFLTSIQSVISVTLVIITTVIYSQIGFMINQDKGIDIDNIVIIETPEIRGENYRTQLGVYKNMLLAHPFVQSVSTSSTLPGSELNYATPVRLPRQREEESVMLFTDGIDETFTEHYGAKLLAGRNFDPTFGRESDNAVLNETSVRLLGISSPEEALQNKVIMEGDTLTIVGVIGDYNHHSLKQSINPLILRFYRDWVAQFSVKMSAHSFEDWSEQLSLLEVDYHEAFGENLFNATFLEQQFNAQYDEDRSFGSISGFFSAIAIIISILGLLGFIAFTVSIKSKEIAIRKVLGASKGSIILNISKSAILLNLLSGLIAGGIAYYYLGDWLNQYATKLNLTLLHFLIPIVGLVVVVGMIITIQAMSLLSKNPVSAINTES